ncbi:MAG TPA: sulfoxide reductase heme-binding subunit YedZ, partial [Thiotrichaceae bacterium]|nr:sulfoxide reductase heme-binding subunit YedZ [Thiotrichaceae bacterium]
MDKLKLYFIFNFKLFVFSLACLPVLFLMWGFWSNSLGVNPIEEVIHQTGDWTLRFLLISLSVSPLRRLLLWNQLVRVRPMLGLFAFFYASLHLMSYLWLDQFFLWDEMFLDIINRPFITLGFLAYILLIPLAITSTLSMVKRLKKYWKKLHRLVYIIPVLGIIHYWWLVKSDISEPVIYSVLLLILLLERLKNRYF